jgi:hypothetical protein
MTKLCELIERGWLRVLMALCVLGMLRPAHAEEKISEEAKGYFKNGVELIQQSPPNYQDAYYQFKLAYEKSNSWKVLGNLGLCAFKLERDGEALQAYNDYLKGGGKNIDSEERKAMERDVLLITGNTSSVNLTADATDATVLDARAGSPVPPQTYKLSGSSLVLRLRAGTHTLTATSPDGRQQKWDVSVTPGQTLEHRFEFNAAPAAAAPVAAAAVAAPPATATEPSPAPAAPPPAADQGASKGGGSPLRTVGFVAAGVGGAALIGGIVTGLMAKSSESKAKDQCQDKVCPTKAASDFDSAASLATVTNVLLIGGGVLAAAGVTLVIVGGKGNGDQPPKPASAPRLEVVPAVAGNGAGLFARGAF